MKTPHPAPVSGGAPAPAELNAPSWQMLERSVAATALADLDGRIVYVNPAFLSLWGFADVGQVLGRAADGIFWTGRAEAGRALQAVMTQRAWQGELMACRADGTPLPVWCSAHMVYGDDGQPLSIMASFIDRSAEVAARSALDRERDFVEAVIGAAGVLVTVLDEQGRFVRFNAECERLSGWRAGEVLGRQPWGTVLPLDVAQQVRDEAFDAAMAVMQPGDVRRYTNEWQARNGTRRRIDWTNSLLLDRGGQARFMVTIGVDVTARDAAEAALQRSEAQLRQAQQVARLGSWELDHVSGRLDWSDEVFVLFEIDKALFGASYEAFLDLIHPDDRPAVDAAFAQSLGSQQAYAIEHRLLMPDGRVKWVEEQGQSVYDASGRPRRSVGTVQDVTERHRRDADLRRFRHMVDRASQEVWLSDAAARIRYVNEAAAASLGYMPDELMRLSLGDIDAAGPASVAEQIRRIGAQAAATGMPMPFEVVHRARDGRLVPKEVRPTLFELDGESFRCSFAQDISERLQARATLAAAEAQLRATLDAFPGWVACVDDEMRYGYVNEALCRQLKRPRDQILGHSVEELRGAAVAAELRGVVRRLQAGERIQMERRYPDVDGVERIYWVHYSAANDLSAPDRQLFYAFGTDVTESSLALLRLNTIVERTGIGLWEWNAQTGALQVNPQLPLLVGHEAGEVPADLPGWLRTHVHPQDRAARKAQMQSVLAGRAQAFQCEFRGRHRSGQWVWLLERGRVVSFTADGRPLMLIGTLQDITALKANEQALQHLNEELEDRVERRTRELALAKADAERASAAKTEFLSRMSHELRTPLNAILGFGQLLELAPLPAEDGRHVKEIVRAGRHLLDLINEVLDLATVESGRMALTLQRVELHALVDECMALMQPAARQAELHLESRIQPDCRAVVGDRGRLKQVLLNLLSNAVKYNRRGGQVIVDCNCRPDADGPCEIRVTDTGHGLAPDQIDRLFQPFERLDAARGVIPGTGIGLSVSKRLVELMGGEIGVRSEPGQGSSFWLRMPADAGADVPEPAADAARAVPWPEVARAAAATGKVLYIEDNPANQRLMQHILSRRRDVDLVCSADPSAAVALARQQQPALVLLDIQLPGLDGYEVLASLRAAGVAVPAVAVSANAMPADVARGLAAGFAAYLTKPLDVQRVLAVLDAYLPATASDDLH